MNQHYSPSRIFKFDCKQCDGTSYNVNHAGFKDTKAYNITCHKCPYQASCIDGIKSKGNYWATTSESSQGKVTFTLCPSSYCCVSLKTCFSYNTCHEHREGRLCGDCEKDHVISLFTYNKCVPKGKCENNGVLWTLYLISVVATCLFVLYSADAWKAVVSSLMGARQHKLSSTTTSTGSGNNYDDGSSHDLREPLMSGQQNHEENSNYGIDHSATRDQLQPLILETETPSQQDNTRTDSPPLPQPNTKTMKFFGLVKTAFFFYQTASIIRVPASAKTAYTTTGLIGLVTSIFNIKIDVATTGSTSLTLCPFDTSNVIGMEAFRSSVPPLCLLVILTLMLVTNAVTWLQKKYLQTERPRQPSQNLSNTSSRQSTSSSSVRRRTSSTADNSPIANLSTSGTSATETKAATGQHKQQKTFMCRLKGGYVNLMLLGYSSVALFCLHSVHCVGLSDGTGKTYLFVQASVECYQWWQQILIVTFVTCVAPFPITLYIGCRLLRSGRISSNKFLIILTLPPTVFAYGIWFWGGCSSKVEIGDKYRKQTKQEREHILSVLNEPFRRCKSQSDEDCSRALIWEPVLIGRRLVLVVITTFILSPILRLYPVGVMLLGFAVHDYLKKPYNSRDLNLLQFFSTLVLLLLLQVNICLFFKI